MQKKLSDKHLAKKELGQHFLTSESIARQVVEAAGVTAADTVLEIGPGTGMLTNALLLTGAAVVAVEKDADCIAPLTERFADALEKGRLRIHQGDIRQNSPEVLKLPKTYKLVANIPYYITGEIIRTALTQDNRPQTMALLVQKEVAERIARSEKESLLSLSVKAYGAPTYVRTVKAGSFHPVPKVDSAILAISDISGDFFDAFSEEYFFTVLRAGFGEKRKQLGGTLGEMIGDKQQAHALLMSLDIDPRTRPEDLSLLAWKQVAAVFIPHMHRY